MPGLRQHTTRFFTRSDNPPFPPSDYSDFAYMAKKFLDILGDAFDDEVLDEVIPAKRPKTPAPTRRKKRFLETISEKLPEDDAAPLTLRRNTRGVQLTLLETMEEALESQVFDSIFPKPVIRTGEDPLAAPQLESPFSTMITTQVLERARQIALAKGIRVKDVINKALEFYVDREWKAVQG
ncbi:MAG: hypothetical protein OHK0039_40250 [Bacteroidia bacterium]